MKENKIVYNLDHNDYSELAIQNWKDRGYQYYYGDFSYLTKFPKKNNVKILIVRLSLYIDKKVLDLVPNVKYILSATTGSNHINSDEISSRNIKLISLRGEESFLKSICSTAEFTWGLLLNMFRNITSSSNDVKEGNWNRENFKGFDLSGKNIGIVGLGRIGNMVSKYALSFGMVVRYCDPNVQHDFLESCSLYDLAKKSDILTIHIHSDLSNIKLIDSKIIDLMPKGSYLVNTSRGEVWDEQSVYKNIVNDKLAGVATDVIYEEQKNLEKSILWKNKNHPKILITPHLGGASYDAMWRCELKIQEKFFQNVNMR